MRCSFTYRWSIAIVALLLSVMVRPVAGHSREDARRLLLSFEAERIDSLVVHRVPQGAPSERLDRIIDVNHDGRVSGPVERLARAQLLLPRAMRGISARIEGHVLEWNPVRLAFDRGGPGRRLGWTTAVSHRLAYPESSGESQSCRPFELRVERGTAPLSVIVEVQEPLRLQEPPGPQADDERTWGPIAVSSGESFRVCIVFGPHS